MNEKAVPYIAFQGCLGAYSDLACRAVRPGWQSLPCDSFSAVIDAVRDGRAQEALLPCENSLAGRVPEIHSLLPEAGLRIIGEYFQRVEHCLLGVKGASLSSIRRVHSHPVALAQIRRLVRENGFETVSAFDTSGAARQVAQWGKITEGAIASSLAAELYGLEIIARNVEDATHNTTRFYHVVKTDSTITGPESIPVMAAGQKPQMMTTMMVDLPNIPGALYALLGCFARYGVNMTRIESYMLNGSFAATRFLIDVAANPGDAHDALVFKSVETISRNICILGVYPQSKMRDDVSLSY